MDSQILVLRILHILFGAYWVGTDVFTTFLLLPRLRALGPAVERPVVRSLMRVLPPALMVSSVVTVVTGVLLIGKIRGWSVLFATGWGWAIFVALVLTGVALIVGFGLIPPVTMSIERVNRSIEGRAPTPNESHSLDRLTGRVTALARFNSVLLLIVVVTMAIARYV